MQDAELERIAREWDELTHTVLDLDKFALAEVQSLLKDTYTVLTVFHKEQFIPKGISKILLNMDEFLYFTSLMEEKEVGLDFYQYQLISSIVSTLKTGFFGAKYEYEFPRLKVKQGETDVFIFDFGKDNLKDIK